jgi:hypothetical protein
MAVVLCKLNETGVLSFVGSPERDELKPLTKPFGFDNPPLGTGVVDLTNPFPFSTIFDLTSEPTIFLCSNGVVVVGEADVGLVIVELGLMPFDTTPFLKFMECPSG